MKLYELSTQYSALTSYLESDEPEDSIAYKLQLSQITEQLNTKAENIGKLIINFEAESMAIKGEIERLTRRKNTIENRVKWLKEYLLTEMTNANLPKIRGQVLTLSIRDNPISIEVIDQNQVPKEYQILIPESWQVDKKKIADHVKLTAEILPGIKVITDKKHLEIK